jgi:hypothetical protein
MGGVRTHALFGAVAAMLALAPPALAADLVRNGAFQEGAEGAPAEWRNEAWAREGVEFSWAPAAGDTVSSAGMHNVQANDSRWCQTIPVQTGATYRVSTRVRTSDIGTGASGAHIAVEPRIVDSSDVRGTADWQRLEVEAKAGEERQWDVCLRLGSYANLNTGTAWFTDVHVVQIGAPVVVSGPGFVQRTVLWTRASGFRTALPLLGGALIALGLGIGRSRRL